jgi:hypothetical protein
MAQPRRRNGRNGGARPQRRQRRRNGARVLAQGVGSAARFGMGGVPGASLLAFDATHPMHMPLPRTVGPYAVTRTTSRFSSSNAVMVFGTYRHPSGVANQIAGDWSDICAIGGNLGDVIRNITDKFNIPSPVLAESAGTCVPSAITVQIMNPNALQTTSGIVYAGVAKTTAKLMDDGRTWGEFGNEYVSYMAPRLMSAGKLALRGVKINSYPLNMSSLADFQQMNLVTPGTGTYIPTDQLPVAEGFAPIVVFNPGLIPLEYLVTIEWRTRFDLSNPAASAHRQHPVTSDVTFDKVLKMASSLGHGVLDIADTIGTIGQAAGRLTNAFGGARAGAVPLALMDA